MRTVGALRHHHERVRCRVVSLARQELSCAAVCRRFARVFARNAAHPIAAMPVSSEKPKSGSAEDNGEQTTICRTNSLSHGSGKNGTAAHRFNRWSSPSRRWARPSRHAPEHAVYDHSSVFSLTMVCVQYLALADDIARLLLLADDQATDEVYERATEAHLNSYESESEGQYDEDDEDDEEDEDEDNDNEDEDDEAPIADDAEAAMQDFNRRQESAFEDDFEDRPDSAPYEQGT